MRVFVTGATGYIGSAVVPEFLEARHEVVGLACSAASAAALRTARAEVYRGALDDLDILRNDATSAAGLIHLAAFRTSSAGPQRSSRRRSDRRHARRLRSTIRRYLGIGAAPAGSRLHGVALEDVPFRGIAEAIWPTARPAAPRSHVRGGRKRGDRWRGNSGL
jgi:uncharacterized protein YbjT (DUF2867 family)